MKVRDTLNTIEGYQEIIDNNNEFINKRISKIEQLERDESNGVQKFPKSNIDIIKATKETILSYRNTLFKAKYSIGESISDIKLDYSQIIDSLKSSWKSKSGYIQMVSMLSIGIMLNVEDEQFNTLVQCVKKDNPNDFLIDVLINYRNSNWEQQSEKFMWNKPYKLTQEIVELAKKDKEKALEKLEQYLNAWYKSIEIKTHNSKWNIHSGYWCWEAGALVKILGLDDSDLKDQQYYPYDMVHWKKENSNV